MWTCTKCGERLDDQFDSCWKCAGETAVSSANASAPEPPPAKPLRCPRCHTDLKFLDNETFSEQGGDFARHGFDLYVCPRCGRVEFFVENIGLEFRPK